MKQSELELTFGYQVKVAGLPAPQPEFRFHPTRLWRFDFCWPGVVDDDDSRHVDGPHWLPVVRSERKYDYLRVTIEPLAEEARDV